MIKLRKGNESERTKENYERLYVREGIPFAEIAKRFGLSRGAVFKDLVRFGIKRRHGSPKGRVPRSDIDRSREHYQRLYVEQGMTVRQIAKQMGVSTAMVNVDMHKLGIESRHVGRQMSASAVVHPRRASEKQPTMTLDQIALRNYRPRDDLDMEFFTKIDTPLKAYAMGLIWADGSIRDRALRLELAEGDAEVLVAIAKAIGPGAHVISGVKNKGKSRVVMLSVNSVEFVDRLRVWGLCENKSQELPVVVRPGAEFEVSFVRGLVDGDGCVAGSDYPRIIFSNQNMDLRTIASECWRRITGRVPAVLVHGQSRRHSELVETGAFAVRVAHALYVAQPSELAIPRKRARAIELQAWAPKTKRRSREV
jgi:transposase